MKKLLLLLALAATAFAGERRLVVHEWGTFTSIAGKDGFALEYRPLQGVSDLPSFVYTAGDPAGIRVPGVPGKAAFRGNVRMETPVLYFYADERQDVSVKVGFPKGKITEYYPKAHDITDGIDWGTIAILPHVKTPDLPTGDPKSHYFRARDVAAAPVRVCDGEGYELEKFLFYRGVGTFELPVKAVLADDGKKLRVEGLTGSAVVFENRKGVKSFRIVSAQNPEITLPIAPRCADVERTLVKLLTEEGLYEDEAQAMVATWQDSWFEEGLRVFYFLPRSTTDAVLPLTISPQPTETVRVLVGRAEVITPELEQEVLASVAKLGDADEKIREAAHRELAKHGRFARPILEQAAKHTYDAEVLDRIHQLLAE